MPEEYVAGARRLMASAGNAVLSVHVLDWVRGGGDASRQHKHRFSLSELTASLQAIARTRPAPFEVGVVGGSVVEYAVRVPLDCSRDLSVVVGADDTIHDVVHSEIRVLGPRADLNHVDVSNVTDMAAMFAHSKFKGDVSGWDTAKAFRSYLFTDNG